MKHDNKWYPQKGRHQEGETESKKEEGKTKATKKEEER